MITQASAGNGKNSAPINAVTSGETYGWRKLLTRLPTPMPTWIAENRSRHTATATGNTAVTFATWQNE